MKFPAAPATPAFDDDDDDLPANLHTLRALRGRPHRSALPAPPAAYFDELPARILTRIRTEALRPAPGFLPDFLPACDLSQLRWPRLRLAFTSAALGAAFVGAFWLGQPAASQPGGAERALASVNSDELVDYLADPSTVRLTSADLAALSTTDASMAADILTVSPADLDAAIDDLSFDETYL